MKLIRNISILRIILNISTLILLMIPWYQLGISFPTVIAGGKIIIDTKFLVVGIIYLFLLAFKFIKSQVKQKKSKELKLLLEIEKSSDEIFILGILIILAYHGFCSVIIPIILLIKYIVEETMKKISADNGKMNEKSKLGLWCQITLNAGIALMLFYNLPFELWNFYFADALILIACVLSILNGCIYYLQARNLLINKK